MSIKIALIALLSASTISALSLEGFKCRHHTVATGDPVQPVRTVRICGVEDYETPASFLDYQKLAAIEQNARNNNAARSYGIPGFWPEREAPRAPRPTYAHWPLQRPTESNESAQLLSTLFRRSAVQPATYEAATNYATNARDRMEVERLLQEKLLAITEDTSAVKNSMNDVVANVKNILDALLMQSANQQRDINVNVNLKLDPALEDLLRDFLAIIKSEVNSVASAESTSTKHIAVRTDDDSEDYDSIYSTINVNENSSEEQVTAAHIDSAEYSTQQDAKEEYEGNSSVEDIDSWLRLHFGPIVKTPTYDEDADNSEQENSAEKSEESFESWFNAVYRKHTTEAPTENNSWDEQSSSQESVEHATKESVENLVEIDDEYPVLVDAVKSFEENTASDETTESSEEVDNIYDTIFVPTTMNSVQSSEEAELLENGDRYGYTTGREKTNSLQQKYKCSDLGLRPSLNNLENPENDLIKCYAGDQKVIVIDLSKFNQIEGGFQKIEESKVSAETETAVTDSNESKSSEETETPISESNESKSSEETGTAVTDSNESKSSEETETPTTETNESTESSEVESDINLSTEPRTIDWYQYDDEYPYIQ